MNGSDRNRGRIRVLVVDDEPGIATLVARVLESRSEQVSATPVEDPEEAARLVTSEPFDCVVSDYEMPGLDGFDLLERARSAAPDIPFILYTAVPPEEILEAATERGVTDFIEKNGRFEQFAVVGDHVSRAMGEAEVPSGETEDDETMFVVQRDGSIEYLSPSFLDLTGYDAAELQGDSWEKLFPAVEMKRLLDDVLPTVARTGSWSGSSVGLDKAGVTRVDATSIEAIDEGSLFVLVLDLQSLDGTPG